MRGFSNLRFVKAARHPRRCEQCGKTIQPGERKFVAEGFWEDHFFRSHEHPECMVAKLDYHHEFMREDGDGWPSFWRNGVGRWDRDWLILRHPDAAKRMGLFQPFPTPPMRSSAARIVSP